MPSAKRLNPDQIAHAADALARGESRAAVARTLSMSDRSVRRLLRQPGSALAEAVAAKRRALELQEHHSAKRSAPDWVVRDPFAGMYGR